MSETREPILSPEQVEQCAREARVGIVTRDEVFGFVVKWVASPRTPYYLTLSEIQTDPRFLWPLETLLMERCIWVQPSSEGFRVWQWDEARTARMPMRLFLIRDTHKDAVLEAAKVAICAG